MAASPVRHPAPAWIAMIALAAVFSVPLVLLGLPAAVLLGAMVSGIVFGVRDVGLKMPRKLMFLVQGVVGTILANSLTPALMSEVGQYWPMLLLFNGLTLVAAFAAGWGLHRLTAVDSGAAIMGSLPGMAGAMVLIAQERGLDSRIVALMQYLRMATVIVTLTVISALVPGGGMPADAVTEAPLLSGPAAYLLIALIALTGLPASRIRHLPAAAMLVPMVIGGAAELSGLVHVDVPVALRDLIFLCLGLQVGLRFTRPVLVSVLRLIPAVLGSSLVLVALSAGLGGIACLVLDTDFLTGFLITAPGSIDTVVMIAAAAKANVSLVLAFQTMRLIVVVTLGPMLLERVARLPIWRHAMD
ncbi:AbrB family transcriptional regulator [Pseudooceanicola sp. CBS1P-1]|uniref:AbrB family transcriptional regulator n=1 Tax=Pseudooceanicola albus TaxID=2692189 RepID=A0A6L7G7B4_9RHOB|nr:MULTISPECIES: AbrB family transcriptional regulator [Pseudooceanicola]MBT9383012.1 AbrB family transcriptional regulator [Pseudooceanicola endophyticus]MXN19200.1 hypothetical protein [Pseudooceanicola albus]